MINKKTGFKPRQIALQHPDLTTAKVSFLTTGKNKLAVAAPHVILQTICNKNARWTKAA
jgi:hypothetical protein